MLATAGAVIGGGGAAVQTGAPQKLKVYTVTEFCILYLCQTENA